jgi:hypothetical protein
MTLAKAYNFVVKYDDVKVERVECFYKDAVTLVYKFKDRAGNLISTSGATAFFRMKHVNDTGAALEYTELDSIAVGSNTITVVLDTEDLGAWGNMVGQLQVTLGSDVRTVEGRIKVKSLIE